jgi:beta-glucosidase
MTAYNTINGFRAAECYDLITGILRGEWGYNGIVISDWWNRSEQYKEILAGEDVKMATGFPERVKKALTMGLIKRKDLEAPVKRILQFIMKLD